MGYLANFIVYLMAMTGLIGLSIIVFKATTSNRGKCNRGGLLKVVESMSLGARKTLYIIEADGEKFLIAGDADRTSLISKLESENIRRQISASVSANGLTETVQRKPNYADRTICGITGVNKSPYESVVKNLTERIRN